MPPDQGMQLELEAGDALLPRSWPVKPAKVKLSDRELAEPRAQPIDHLDRGWIQRSTTGHAAAAVFARKPDGSWSSDTTTGASTGSRLTRPAVGTLRRIDALLDCARPGGVALLHQA